MPLQRKIIAGTYPVASVEFAKPYPFVDADAVVEGLLRQIEEHPRARLVAVFDLLEHAWESESSIPPDMRGVKQVIVCFGGEIRDANALALRPHTLSVVETTTGFAVSFMETHVPDFDQAMATWLDGLTLPAT